MRLFADLGLELHRVIRGATDVHTTFRRRLATTVLVTLVVDAVGTVLMYVLEHGQDGSHIGSLFKSFFWVTTQLLTVSSQMPNPVTTGGRIVDIMLEVWAITVVATVAATFTAFLQKK
jgi:ABC-type phosphate/phosphonate transport system permease subunit